jgi:hypothetical protein
MNLSTEQIEFGDFKHTELASRLPKIGRIRCPATIIEPTCGVGAFVRRKSIYKCW